MGWLPFGPFRVTHDDPFGWKDERGVSHNPQLTREQVGQGACPGCDTCGQQVTHFVTPHETSQRLEGQ
jgi:hypothetical protein